MTCRFGRLAGGWPCVSDKQAVTCSVVYLLLTRRRPCSSEHRNLVYVSHRLVYSFSFSHFDVFSSPPPHPVLPMWLEAVECPQSRVGQPARRVVVLGCASVTVGWCYTRDKANGLHFCCSSSLLFVSLWYLKLRICYDCYGGGLCNGKKLRVTSHCLLRTFNNISRADIATAEFNHLPEFKSNGFVLFTRLENINALRIYVNLKHYITLFLEMGGTCSMHERDEKCRRNFDVETRGKRPLEEYNYGREGDVNTHWEIRCEVNTFHVSASSGVPLWTPGLHITEEFWRSEVLLAFREKICSMVLNWY